MRRSTILCSGQWSGATNANHSFVLSLIALACLVLAVPAFAIDEYRWDDNSGNSGWGVQTTQPDRSFAWLNHFVIQPPVPVPMPQPQTITAIRVAFGGPPSSVPIPNGTPVSLYLWADTNGDATPYNGAGLGEPVLRTTTGVVANTGTNLFNTYAIPPITLQPGTSIFAGAIINDDTGPHTVGRLDEHGLIGLPPVQSPFNKSWVAISAGDYAAGTGAPPVDPFDLSAAQVPPDLVSSAFPLPSPGVTGASGDGWWMIRLNATIVPEPNSVVLLMMGVLGVIASCRQRKL